MVKVLDEHERTMAFAEVALGQIKSLRHTANPRNYEIWYVYATGYNPQLNKIINETLARNGKLTEPELDQLYETYLSHLKTTDRIDKVGARVIGEIDDVMNLITDALGRETPHELDGRDPLAPGAGKGVYFESYFGTKSFGWGQLAGWTDGRAKYVHSSAPELYDLAADPGETRNLLAARRAEGDALRANIAALCARPRLPRVPLAAGR